ncbi:MAG: protein-methionine-sulfoxide reductase catalytic subunit MsrP [Hyphomicrobiales bacterium]|nr:protein-methionine-sulfoxide reductase catalytic subunit MsrP [Hyphomicrobiales bacterium]
MLIKRPRGWELPESAATPEHVYVNRRQLMAAGGAAVALTVLPHFARAEMEMVPTADLYPARRNLAYRIDRDITPEELNSTYNNFYEFGSHKEISKAAQALKVRPWMVKIDGEVEKPFEIDIDELIRKMGLEERLYRHRCVEAWSMTIPWTGFPVSRLVELAKPLSAAKYLRMETFMDSDAAHGQRQSWYPWPYVEGLTMAEAANDLAFMVTGAYGKPAAKQFGAPLRLHVPWKYGFKSIKSIVGFSFVRERPVSFWEEIAGNEYGFWANVNPQVPHPRWSQATERVLGTDGRIPTRLFNGYGDYVADLYAGLSGENLFM